MNAAAPNVVPLTLAAPATPALGAPETDMGEIETRERIVRLETQMAHLSQQMDELLAQVRVQSALLEQAKGAKLALALLFSGLGITGGVVGTWLMKLSPIIGR